VKNKKWQKQVDSYYQRERAYYGGLGVVRTIVGVMWVGTSLYSINTGDMTIPAGMFSAILGAALTAWGIEASRKNNV